MRRYSVSYSNEVYKFLNDNASNYTIKQLVQILKNDFGLEIERKKLAQYCIKMGITYKYEKPNKSHSNKPTPIGVIVRKNDGDMLKVKVGNHKWKYKQRYIYEQYHKVELPKEIMVIFLDGDRTNFDINNLMAVSTPEYNCIKNKDLLSNNSMVTKTAILGARLYYKIKEKES